jgi:hypothetical protein
MTLDAIEFLRRFCLNILPFRFVKIRHYGFLSARKKGTELPVLQGKEATPNVSPGPRLKLSWKQICRQRLGFDPDICPCRSEGRMVTIEVCCPVHRHSNQEYQGT